MAGNTTKIDELVDPIAVEQFSQLKTAGKQLRTELSELLEVAIKLNATLGGSTPATFNKNLQASTAATEKIIANNNKQIDNEAKKAAKQEEIYNKYLVMLSKQESARQAADAKEIQQAEAKASKLKAISDKQEAERARKAAVQFTDNPGFQSDVTSNPANPSVRYEPIITGEENMAIAATKSAEAIAIENAALLEQTEVLDSLSASYRANIKLLLTLQVERAENLAAQKALTVEDAAGGERMVFLTAEQLRLKTAIQQTNLVLSQQTKQLLAEDTSGALMQARLDELRVAIGNLSTAELQNIEISGVWIAEANLLDTQIKNLRDSTGDHTKHVGDYERAQGKATNAAAGFGKTIGGVLSPIRQLAYILPGIGMAGLFNLAFEAILKAADALGIFSKEVKYLLTDYEKLEKAAADAGTTQLTALDTLYTASQNLNIPLSERVELVKKLQTDYPAYFSNISQEAILVGKAKAAYDELSQSILNRAVISAAQKNIEELSKPLVELIVQEKTAQAAYDKANKEFFAKTGRSLTPINEFGVIDQTDKADRNGIGMLAGSIPAKLQTIKEYKDKLTSKINEAKAGLQQALEDFGINSLVDPDKIKKPKATKDTGNTDLLEYNRIKLAESQKINKAVLDNDQNSYDTRMVALGKYLSDSRALIKNSEAIIDADINLRAQQRINMKLELSNKSKDIDREAVAERDKLAKDEETKRKQTLAELVTTQKEAQQEQLEDLNQGAIVAAQTLESNRDKLIRAKTLEFSQRKITEKQFNRDLLAINDEYNVQRIAQELTIQQSILEIEEATRDREIALATSRGATPEELAKINSGANKGITGTKNNIAGLTNQLSNAKNKQLVDGSKGDIGTDKDGKKALAEALGEAQQITGDIQDLIDAGYENQISKLNKIGEKIQENAQIEKDAVSNSLDTQANKSRAQLVIDAQTASAQKSIQQQIAAEKTKQARADKVAAIAEIILNTAIATTKVTAQAGLLGLLTGVPAVIALGAIQLAKVVATPIPQFAKGTPTGGHKGGLAIVGDGGGPERIIEPGKTAYYSPGVATMMHLPKGTVVEPYKMLPATPQWTASNSGGNGDVVAAIDRLARKEQHKQKQPRLNGWVEAQRQADAWNNKVSNHFR